MPIHFHHFELDPATGLLQGPEGEVRLRPKTLALLQVLVERAPGVVEKDELVDLVWGREHLGPSSLAQAVSELRGALGDDPRQPRIIETMHRRGYRFIAAVEIEEPGASRPEANAESSLSSQSEAPPADASPSEAPPSEAPPQEDPERRLPESPAPVEHGASHPRVSRRQVVLWGAVAGLALLLASVLASVLGGPEGDSVSQAELASAGSAHRLQRVALLPFEPLEDEEVGMLPTELAWLDLGLRQMLAQRLDRHPQLYLYPLERVQAMQRDLPETTGSGDHLAAVAERYLEAHWLIQGQWSSPAAGTLRYRLWLRPTTGDGAAVLLEDEIPLEALPAQVHHWARQISQELVGAPRRGRGRAPMPRRELPVIERYFTALGRMEEEPLASLRVLEELAQETPTALALAKARIELLEHLGRREEAREVAATGFLMAEDVSDRVYFLLVQGHTDEALVLARKMGARSRQDPERWFEWLVRVEGSSEPKETLAWLETMPAPARGRWLAAELSLVEARAAAELGDVRRARRAVQRAQRVGRQQGHRAAVAEAEALLVRLSAAGAVPASGGSIAPTP